MAKNNIASQNPKNEKFKGSGNVKVVSLKGQPLVPGWLFCIAFMISFSLPNLVFSGRSFFDTLHIMKWTVTMVPIGVLALVAGVQLVRYGAKRLDFVIDPFGAVWLLLLFFITLQPLFIDLSSISTFAKEWFYFACLFATYILAYNLCKSDKLHRALLWGGNVNAAINVLFAELLIRHLNDGFPFILGVPGNYIGNTAQQEMFGLWMAMAVLNCLFLHLAYAGETEEGASVFKRPIVILNLFLLAVNSWGLWSSTARGAILALCVAFVMMVLTLWRGGQKRAIKNSLKLFGVVVAFMVLVLAISSIAGTGRGYSLIAKTLDMITNPGSIGGRVSIWQTSWEVYLTEPITGVGLGQYKWHFLDGQRIMYEKHPELIGAKDYSWQFTYWAHSEYIQWLCETGIFGALALLALAAWWLYGFLAALIREKNLPPEAIWGCAMIFMLWFDALFSRPFHRIENSVWMSLAFALSNRTLLPRVVWWTAIDSDFIYRCFGGLVAAVSLLGFVFLAQGIYGDKLMYKAVVEQSSALQKQEMLQKASSYLMSRDDAKEQLANLFIQVGKIQEDTRILGEGLNNLYASFTRRPTSKLLFELLNYSRQFGSNELLNMLTPYLTPDMRSGLPVPGKSTEAASGAKSMR